MSRAVAVGIAGSDPAEGTRRDRMAAPKHTAEPANAQMQAAQTESVRGRESKEQPAAGLYTHTRRAPLNADVQETGVQDTKAEDSRDVTGFRTLAPQRNSRPN